MLYLDGPTRKASLPHLFDCTHSTRLLPNEPLFAFSRPISRLSLLYATHRFSRLIMSFVRMGRYFTSTEEPIKHQPFMNKA